MTRFVSHAVEYPSDDILRQFDVAGPRYTSYPTADRFNPSMNAEVFGQVLADRQKVSPESGLSVYCHVPFCSSICYYCGCNKIVTRDHSRSKEYIEMIGREAQLVADRLTGRRTLEQLHFGGGSPTYLENDEFVALMQEITSRFPLEEGGEFSIEVDPRSCPPDKIAVMAKTGLNRMSIGVQDFDERVQKAVNRIQPFEMTKETIEAARANGFNSVNMDLIYGLPLQNRKSFAVTLDKVIELSPDRIALYHYAHLPRHFPPQRMIHDADLPSTPEKAGIMMDAIKRLGEAGYVYIGMDHFAKKTDELARAQMEGKLQRNFQGYSTRPECDMVALGVSAISKVCHAYAANPRDIEHYYAAIREGRLATERGYMLSDEDELRRAVIMQIMCQFELVKADIERQFGIEFDKYFAYELKTLKPYAKAGLCQITDEAITVSPTGKILVRAIAMQFDRYLREDTKVHQYSKIA